MDVFVDSLLREESYFDVKLPYLKPRQHLDIGLRASELNIEWQEDEDESEDDQVQAGCKEAESDEYWIELRKKLGLKPII